jgi:tRNA threonylcarbamoyladenosine biosynthesis protein TsaB
MNVQMLVLALDTTTRAGSVALARGQTVLDSFAGDASRTHAARLPGDILEVLSRNGVALADIDLYAVAAGPGSFTGLRIGIAAIQGLAFANQKPVVAVSALEALAYSMGWTGGTPVLPRSPTGGTPVLPRSPTGEAPVHPGRGLIGAWMDAQRGEVYAQLFGPDLVVVDRARVNAPEAVLDAWAAHLADGQGGGLLLVGDGALAYRERIAARLPRASIEATVPRLAPAIARLATARAAEGLAGPPHAVRPLYIRRPDAELARERQATGGTPVPPSPTPVPPSPEPVPPSPTPAPPSPGPLPPGRGPTHG